MTFEFNNRITAQREILNLINSKLNGCKEELFGLSSKAIDRWVSVNAMDSNSRTVSLVTQLSEKLFFLANKSQEQISPEYKQIKYEMAGTCQDLDRHLSELSGVGQSRKRD